MRNFSDYINSPESEVNKKSKNMSNENTVDLEKLIDKYSSLSDNDLMKEFVKMTIERKKQGNLSNAELENLKNTIVPYLNESQKETMGKILELIKNVWEDR